ncbi:hypothetical protein Halru_0610 [Halovivax ruber XH-70]|uniref:Uncharacterized protein n=1 Tax=Halovivax ruber (strain DSM 18193 / JCM 13892 / XH-70) TaxID=797302 RepID=L0IBB1_HALRX|nr:hypothetical protein [Halovivax ruber]AGB15237.1 hypothetical protein Halru_0610 [Halovivax ruber XH-70]
MSWEEQWPGEPYQVAEAGRVPDASPFRVALKRSACAAAAEIETLRQSAGEVLSYDSRADAVAKLIHAVDCPGLRFQEPAPNDPADVDAYLVKVRDPRPSAAARGDPATGWTFDTRAQQVGALAEALFDAYRYDPPPIVAYAARDLERDPDTFRVRVDDDPDRVGGLDPDLDGAWHPDVAFTVRDRDEGDDAGRVLKRYVAEVKHGSTSFERNQRDGMVRLAERDTKLDVLLVRVDLSGVPQSYDLTIRSVDDGGLSG